MPDNALKVSAALRRQTIREMKEGARQSKRHARAEAAEKREAVKKNMTMAEYRNWKFERWEKKQPKKKAPETLGRPMIDPNVVYPHQARRQALIADALLRQSEESNSAVLKLLELQNNLERALELAKGLY